jgi:hypothetical protein
MELLKTQTEHFLRSWQAAHTFSDVKKNGSSLTMKSMVLGMVLLKDHASRFTETQAVSENCGL